MRKKMIFYANQTHALVVRGSINQIVGRGTRLFDGKHYFTIFDFVDAYEHYRKFMKD